MHLERSIRVVGQQRSEHRARGTSRIAGQQLTRPEHGRQRRDVRMVAPAIPGQGDRIPDVTHEQRGDRVHRCQVRHQLGGHAVPTRVATRGERTTSITRFEQVGSGTQARHAGVVGVQVLVEWISRRIEHGTTIAVGGDATPAQRT
ncbi:MAG: hypothetical protein JWL76_695 [Thermoleophilia bacterium]|nr:hypothetical protein [Thermoleophilia bacterium]